MKFRQRLTHIALISLLVIQSLVYPWISILPAPPPIYAQESPPEEATNSAQTLPTQVGPAPSPLDLLLNPDIIFTSTISAETIPPEVIPEATMSATPESIPETPISTPSATPTSSALASPSPSPTGAPENGNTEVLTPTPSPTPSPSTLHIESESSREMPPDAEQSGRPPALDPFLIPLNYPFTGTYPMSYGYGETSGSNYVLRMQSLFEVDAHDGIDFGMPEGTSILATGHGEVTYSGNGLYGITVIIQHSWGRSYYGHLSQISVAVGDKVFAGQEIGLSGNTGVSTAPHLHFGIRPNHYDPYNGYHGMIDPLPYLNGTVLGASTPSQRLNFAHILKPTLLAEDESVGVLLTEDPSSLTFSLRNPQGEQRFIYPTVLNFGTGETALITRPNPFVPGRYSLTITRDDGAYDIQNFDWGVLTLNTDQATYAPGSLADLSLAVLDHAGEMVCDAELTLTITSPDGKVSKLSTPKDIAINLAVCQSKDLSLSPDYHTTYQTKEVGAYSLVLTAKTSGGTYTINDSFNVKENLPFELKRHSATRIYPAHRYPVVFEITPKADYSGSLTELVPDNFDVQPLSLAELKDWTQVNDESVLLSNPYKQDDETLSWNLNLRGGTTYYLGYSYDSPDDSPRLYTLGPANIDDFQESRSWNIAVDAVTKHVGYFSPPTTWTSAGNANLALAQPDPRDGDLMVATLAIRPSASTINTPSGWTLIDSRTATDGGAEGVDAGSVGVYTFYKLADGTEGNTAVTFTESGTTSVWIGNISKLRSATGTYDVAGSSYAISGDATNWGGTLATDIGLSQGDVVLLIGGQVGDASNTSAWALSATGVTSLSTGNEHGEYTSGTGNDIEVGLAATQVWEGNNSATPTIALTQSAATSGVVMAVRIRQGSGTNRSDSWVRAAGPQIGGTASVSVAYPEHEPGDLLLLFVGSRISTNATPTTPTGWTSLGSYNGGIGTFGADAGNARTTVYYLQTGLRYTGTQTVALTSGNTMIGQMLAVHHDGNVNWVIDQDGGTDASAGTGWSATGAGIDLDSASGGDLVLVGSATNTDAYTYSAPALSASGVTVGEVTMTGQFITSGGNDMGLTVATARITAGSGSAAPTYTMTSSGTAGSAPTGSSMFIKVNTTSATTDDNNIGYFSPPASWTSAGDANLALAQPDPRDGDLMVATLAIRPASSTINTPSGWTLVDSRTATDGGAEGADAGSMGVYTFTKVADGSEGSTNVTFTESGTTSVWIGNIDKFRSATGTYDVAGSSYAISGDATNWGGTLATDIGLTQGDVVLLVGGQVGDASNTSAWDMTASGITVKSSANEHGEFASTTGNDIEVGLATVQVWEGTNSATPTIALTQSAATSGVVMAVRIRQGSGTNRTDSWIRSAGPQIGGTTSIPVVYPEHEIGDLLLLFVGSRITTNATPTTPSGWTSLGSYNGGTGTFGADAGNARTTVYYARAGTRMTGVTTVALGSGDTMIGQILAVHHDGDDVDWQLDSDGGTDSSAGTGWSATGAGIDLDHANGGDLVLLGSSINTDAYTYSTPTLTASGVTVGDVTMTGQYNYSGGNDMNLSIATARITAGSGSAAPTYTMTSSGTAGSAPTGSSMFIKVVAVSITTVSISGTSDGNDGATVKVAFNSTVQPQSGVIDTGTWSITGLTEPSVTDVVTVWVDNVADNLESTAVTLYLSSPVSGLVLNTNTLSLGNDQDQSLSLTNLDTYDCTQDEDIMHQAASDQLKVEGDACAGSTTNSYTSEKISILSGDTLTLGTSETITTYDLENAGTITVTGNGTLNVSHDWANTGTFTAGTSTVNLNGVDSSTQTISGSTSFYNLTGNSSSNWYNSSWTYRQKITIDHSKVESDQTDFPVYINLTDLPSSFHTHVNQTDARDIRVTKNDGTTELPREVVFYDSSLDTGELHVKYTGTLSASYDTDIYIYYGNAGASDYAVTDTYGRNNVWTNSYAAVYHLKETGAASADEYKDSFGTNDGQGGAGDSGATPSTATGQVYTAQDFDGTDDFISIADDATLDITSQITVSSWIYSDAAQAQFDKVIAKDKVTYYPFQLGFNGAADDKLYFTVSDSANDRAAISNADIATTTWTYTTGTYNGSIVKLFVNAAEQTTTYSGSFSIETNNNALLLGGRTSQFFNGRMDEVRISSTARSSTWITAEYNNQSSPSTFYSMNGSEATSVTRTIRFTAGTTQTVTGTWTVAGSLGSIVVLESSAASAWTINPSAASIDYASVSYSTNSGVSFCATNSIDALNNAGWNLICIPTAHSFQRKTWHDGNRYWRSSFDLANQRLMFEYSSDGSSWTENTSARITTSNSDYSVEADSANLFVVYTTSSDIKGRAASSYPGVGFGWGSEQVVLNGTGGTDNYSYPVISRDSTSNVWVAARFTGAGVYYLKTIKEAGGTNDLPEDSGDTVYSLSDVTNTSSNVYGNIVSIGTSDMYISYAVDAALKGCVWDNDDTGGRFEDSSNNACTGGGGFPTVAEMGTTYSTTVDTTSHVIDLPDNISSGNLLLITGNIDAASGTFTWPGGWTQLYLQGVDAGGSQRSFAGYRIADGSEGTTMTLTTSSEALGASIWRITGWHGTTVPEISTVATGTDASPNPASLTPSWGAENTLWVAQMAFNPADNFTSYPTNYSSNQVNTFGGSAGAASDGAVASRELNTASEDPTAFTLSGTSSPWAAHTIAIRPAPGIGNQDSIATGLSGITTTISSVSDSSGNVHLSYINSSGNVEYRKRTTSWQTPVTLDSNAGNTYPTISLNTSNSDLYAFWIRSDDIYYKKGVSTYLSGDWDASATSWQASLLNSFVTSSYASSDKIFAQWYNGSALAWDKLTIASANTAPDSPSSLAQKTTSDTTIPTGNWLSDTSVKFSATATDTDNPDTLYLCVEKDILGVSFSNTEDSCGTGVAYSGSGVTVSHIISSQTDDSEYHWQARIKDSAGAYSAWVSYDVNAESARDYGLDSTAPTGGTIYDGTGAGVDVTYSNTSLSTLSANWASISSNVSGLVKYEYSIGTSAGATDIKTWTDNSTTTSVTATSLTLQSSTLYFFNVRTTDGAGNVSTPISSNGQLVAPSISFTISPASLSFNNLSFSNSYTDTQNTTLTTSTNAYNGYVIRAFATDYLRSTDSATTIADFSAGSYASPATWAGAELGFGYTSSDTTIQGSNKFGTGTLFAPFSHTGPGDIVADHTTTVSGTPVAAEVFTLTYKVKTAASQAAKKYTGTVVYTATAQY